MLRNPRAGGIHHASQGNADERIVIFLDVMDSSLRWGYGVGIW